MHSVMARLLLIAAALLYGVAALGNGLDRWALSRPLTRVVPASFAAMSLQRDANAALTAGKWDTAIALASRAVLAAPSEAASVSLLGAARLNNSQPTEAHAAFKVSTRLGWRDVSTQAYWVAAGIALADQDLTARNLDALMRFAPGLPQSEDILQTLEAEPDGKSQLARYLALGPNWMVPYAKGLAGLPPPLFAVRLGLLQSAAAKGKPTACGTVVDVITNLAYNQSRFAEAAQVWAMSCRQGPAGLVNNPDFTMPQRDRDLPFEWNLPGTGGVSSSLGDGLLAVRNENPGDAIVAQQFVFAPTGPVRLIWSAEADQDAAQLVRGATLLCPDRRDLALGSRGVANGTGQFAVDVDIPANCSPQILVVRAPREAGEIRFSKINLQPLAGPK